MKNKEIEELKYKNIPVDILRALGDLTNGALNYYQAPKTTLEKQNIILSYIEQLEQENQQLKKQKDDVVEYIKENEKEYGSLLDNEKIILRMLGEIDE